MKQRLWKACLIFAYAVACVGGGFAIAYGLDLMIGPLYGAPLGAIWGISTIAVSGLIWVITGAGLFDICDL